MNWLDTDLKEAIAIAGLLAVIGLVVWIAVKNVKTRRDADLSDEWRDE